MSLPPGQPFLFLRHGQTGFNAEGTVCGATDLPLTPLGEAQAEAAAAQVAALPARLLPRAIWCSTLGRARATARPLAARLGLDVQHHPGLCERNWGAWEGQPRAVLRRDETPPGGGEGPGAFRARIAAALDALEGAAPVLIVAHAGVAREIHALLGLGPFHRPGNAELSLWRPEAGRWRPEPLPRPGEGRSEPPL